MSTYISILYSYGITVVAIFIIHVLRDKAKRFYIEFLIMFIKNESLYLVVWRDIYVRKEKTTWDINHL